MIYTGSTWSVFLNSEDATHCGMDCGFLGGALIKCLIWPTLKPVECRHIRLGVWGLDRFYLLIQEPTLIFLFLKHCCSFIHFANYYGKIIYMIHQTNIWSQWTFICLHGSVTLLMIFRKICDIHDSILWFLIIECSLNILDIPSSRNLVNHSLQAKQHCTSFRCCFMPDSSYLDCMMRQQKCRQHGQSRLTIVINA